MFDWYITFDGYGLLLLLLIPISAWIVVYRDARVKVGNSMIYSAIWATISLFFPLGLLFYLLAGRKKQAD